jgi:hypothetical protein
MPRPMFFFNILTELVSFEPWEKNTGKKKKRATLKIALFFFSH